MGKNRFRPLNRSVLQVPSFSFITFLSTQLSHSASLLKSCGLSCVIHKPGKSVSQIRRDVRATGPRSLKPRRMDVTAFIP